MRSPRPTSSLVKLLLHMTVLIVGLAQSALAQPGVDPVRGSFTFDVDIGDTRISATLYGDNTFHYAIKHIDSPTAAHVDINVWQIAAQGRDAIDVYSGLGEGGESANNILIDLALIDEFHAREHELACWELGQWANTFVLEAFRFIERHLPFRKNQPDGSWLHTASPVILCTSQVVTSVPFSSVSPGVSSVTPEQAFVEFHSGTLSIPLLNEANDSVGTLNSCAMTLYPSIYSYSSSWSLSFSRLNPAGDPGTATMSGTTRIVSGCFLFQGMMSQQLQRAHVSGNGVSLQQSGFCFGEIKSSTDSFPAQSFFNGFFEVTIDGIQVFNKTPLLLQTAC